MIDYYKAHSKLLIKLQAEYDAWEPCQTAADKQAYALLGKIYAAGQRIDADAGGAERYALEQGVKRALEWEGSKKWSAGGKPASEVIVTFLLGVRTKRSRKHNWVTALAEAARAEVPGDAENFVAWIEGEGGIEGVLDKRAERETGAEQVTIQSIAKTLNAGDDAVQVAVRIPPESGLGILVVKRKDKQSAEVVRIETDQDKVLKALRDLGVAGLGRKAKRTEVAIRKIEHKSVLTLTRIALRLVEDGKLRKGDDRRFPKAIERLNELPELSKKYFKDGTGWGITSPDHLGKGGKIDVKHPEFDLLDPGRYVTGGIAGALIPYDDFKPGDTEANKKAARAYISSQDRVPMAKVESQSNPMKPVDDPSFQQQDEGVA